MNSRSDRPQGKFQIGAFKTLGGYIMGRSLQPEIDGQIYNEIDVSNI